MINKTNTKQYTHQMNRLALAIVAFWSGISKNHINDCVWLMTS